MSEHTPLTEAHAAWWPEKDGRCGEINPDRTHYCDRPSGHEGEHAGPELPTVILEES